MHRNWAPATESKIGASASEADETLSQYTTASIWNHETNKPTWKHMHSEPALFVALGTAYRITSAFASSANQLQKL